MPCNGGPLCEDSGTAEVLRAEIKQLGAHLCEALTLLDENGLLQKASGPLRQWYRLHEQHERARIKMEARAKLTKRELRALDLAEEDE